jgi:MoaA/NifB/PqqE/SkfB family radical SAM enzyme
VARQHGMELRLPGITLREKRRCSFVEEGGAFVSWEGNVSPCYFLWHRYSCFASNWLQQVQPKVFGNLAQQGILQVWNDPAFRAFREDVLAYDYPNCTSCTLAPCDYVQTEDFQQDCHIKDVPCGACLWCTGVFQCLR